MNCDIAHEGIIIVAHAVGPYGGQEKALEEFALHSQRSGFDTFVVAYKVSKSIQDANINVTLLREPRSIFLVKFLWFWFVSPVHISKLPDYPVISCGGITRQRVDAVWLHFWHAESLRRTRWFNSWEGSPTRFTIQAISRIFALLAEQWSIRAHGVKVLVAVSKSQARALKSAYPKADIQVLENPVIVRATPSSEYRSFSPEYDREPRVIFVGGAWGHKGLLPVARALSKVAKRRGTKIRMSIVGKGRSRMLNKVERLGGVVVEHTQWTNDISEHLVSADLFMMASRYETFSMAGHEALSAGLPVISTDVHGLGDAVRATGLGIITSRNVENLAQAVEKILWTAPYTDADRKSAAFLVNCQFGDDAISSSQTHLLRHLNKSYATFMDTTGQEEIN